jgi:hypothetical protein
MGDPNRGLYRRYNVYRADGSSEIGGKHDSCEYFVLDLTHDKFAERALYEYALACRDEYPFLSNDLLRKVNELQLRSVQPQGEKP